MTTEKQRGRPMRRLKMAMYVSLDGVYENPTWTFPFWNDELAQMQKAFLFSSDAMVLGRVTYEAFAATWPSMSDNDGFADRMNSMPKFVASRRLKTATWNASILQSDLASEVRRLKEGNGGDLLVNGSGELVTELTRLGLVDRYRLMIHPVALGSGKKLFEGLSETQMKLTAHAITKKGVAVLDFQLSRSA